MTPPWTDWLTESFFRIRISPLAAEKLEKLAPDTQERLRQMVRDIAELADLVPPSTGRSWRTGDAQSLLQLRLGRVEVRYSISEENRTLTIEHVNIPDSDEYEKVG